MATNEEFLDAPIPGQSLTAEPKSRPWRRPSQAKTVDDAVALYAPIFQSKKAVKQMLQQIENGIPLTSLADLLITANAMEGRHNLDVGILVAPILVETMATFAEMADIDYVIGTEDRETPEERTELVNRAMKATQDIMENEETEEPMEMEGMEDEMPTEEPKGLMARRSVM